MLFGAREVAWQRTAITQAGGPEFESPRKPSMFANALTLALGNEKVVLRASWPASLARAARLSERLPPGSEGREWQQNSLFGFGTHKQGCICSHTHAHAAIYHTHVHTHKYVVYEEPFFGCTCGFHGHMRSQGWQSLMVVSPVPGTVSIPAGGCVNAHFG